jgi:predicted DNA-binding transcriptional regulator YafY
MESVEGWSIELLRNRDGKRVYYRYSNPDYSINNMPLNEVEIHQLQSAIQILSTFDGMPQFEWMNELLPKLHQGILESDKKFYISFDSNQYLKGIENLGLLFNSILYERPLTITYQDFKSDQPYAISFHPYYLKQYNNRWFLFGLNVENGKSDWNLALDRIVCIRESSEQYIKNTQIDWEEYFDDIVGVTRSDGANIEDVELEFFGDTCNYILSKPLHGSQKAKWISESRLAITISVIVNFELQRLILSYGKNVRVVAPNTLKTSVRESLASALDQY